MKLSWLAFALCAAVLFVMGTTARSAVFLSEAELSAGRIAGGTSYYDFVGRITTQTSMGESGGSFVLIDSLHALTAAHVVLPSSGATVSSISASFGANVWTSPITTVGISSWETYPGYTWNTESAHGDDLAIITFDRPVTEVSPVSIYSGSLTPVFVAQAAGYGRPGTAGNGLGDYIGDRYAAETTVGNAHWSYSEPQYLLAGFSQYRPQTDKYLVSPGDSGGSWCIDDNGHYALFGLSSFVVDIGGYGSGSISGILDLTQKDYRGWVMSQVPEPYPAAILILGFVLVSCWRKHRVCQVCDKLGH